ncbi:MAG: hypothetical protein KDA60_09025 [Planctomycetales bacterium]|nr:hypothetical protein [Planctomycetales bacterium]
MLWLILLKFLCRLTLGLAAAMWVTPHQRVTSGYYRVHLWVLLGVNTFASLVAWTTCRGMENGAIILMSVVAAAVLSYAGAVCWLYEAPRPGKIALLLVAVCGLLGAQSVQTSPNQSVAWTNLWGLADNASAGLLIGASLAAMFLGHWYLNNPSMQLAPLKRLVVLILVAVIFRTAVAGSCLAAELSLGEEVERSFWAIASLRWLAGIVGTAVLSIMTWQTLKIPNTQSATGILYVGVIFVFLGELTSQLITPYAHFPL